MVETPKNRLGLAKQEYTGLPSTLCRGCGHDSVTERIIQCCYELGIPPHMLVKTSGIGCSSKSPTYFLNRSHGFNGVHGRAPSVSTGIKLANRTLKILLVSGDGDTANIGIGQFMHAVRRNTDMLYIIENNGTYGLTKGQFSATADYGAPDHYGEINPFQPIDLARLAIELGATFVARSFSGDKKQLGTLIKAGLSHQGCAVLDVISPCVTFMNHETNPKSYSYMKEHDIPLHELGYVPSFDEITVEYQSGETKEVVLHDGSHLFLKKLTEDYDPTDPSVAIHMIERGMKEKNVMTGLLYYKKDAPILEDFLQLVDQPLRDLKEESLRPTRAAFEEFISHLK